MKFYVGPVTKNTIDTVIQYANDYQTEFVFIPSRRQIEWDGGYVEHFTTKEFVEYVRSKTKYIQIERDHGGPGQGKIDDDGLQSLQEDCKYMDIIHIDPWKKYPSYTDALTQTISLINYCYSFNKNIEYEIGTEEGIRFIESDELEQFILDVKQHLQDEVFRKIRYCVIQCGTKLLEQTNIGTYDSHRLTRMLEVCKKYNLIAKEHNGDWISNDIVREKEQAGLQCINIAPEFGEIESTILMNRFQENPSDFENFFTICYESNTWKKWVSKDFDPFTNKEKLIKICGHYNFTNPQFKKLKMKYDTIDKEICQAITYRLMELLGIYSIRQNCIMCSSVLETLTFQKDLQTPICYSFFDSITPSYFIPYNIYICSNCHTIQNKYLCNLSLLYKINHIDNFGIVKHNMHSFFSQFITANNHITGIIEIGACHDYLSRLIRSNSTIQDITIIDPSFTGDTTDLIIVHKYLEDCNLQLYKGNTIVMSSVFEHFYNPLHILDILQKSLSIDYIYINHPNMDFALENHIHINLTAEHTFYINNSFLEKIFNTFGFILQRMELFENHTICYEFKRSSISFTNILDNEISAFYKYISTIQHTVKKLNDMMDNNPTMKYYIWPASMHIVPLFINGLQYNRVTALLDNSPNKIGKYFYGYQLVCKSFKDIIQNGDENTCIILGGAPNYKKELDTSTYKGVLVDI